MPTESQLQNTALRLRVCQLIEDGRLPVMMPAQIAAGYGSGRVCVACDLPIASTRVQYEVEERSDGRRLNLHMGCHVVWQLECAHRGPGLATIRYALRPRPPLAFALYAKKAARKRPLSRGTC